ncbi:DUF1800 domain-containing protein [Spirosoma sp. BT702]|uniref:DUF1800 domain-containing protein n=1 Tax=Spirosoma profusum TaxID=2771354 RepID=A0A926XU54_9BACT|nr:DUF1800 domain-containing protein [Spirosoma profusum]MBD2700433.1 DUF1800 domain-containing protein [Spirosoma profusum]
MAYLEPYTSVLTARTAAHLLRRATFGPTQTEITNFTGMTAAAAVQLLISNANYSPPPPIDLDSNQPGAGETYMDKPFDHGRNFELGHYLRCWWLGLMASQTAPPSLLDKLTLFWQNHFVTTREGVGDYRFLHQYLLLLRNGALTNFRTLVIEITKDPAMLRYLNGNENVVGSPNENYGRELQELLTVGVIDFAGNKNYTEDDVKAAARVLTGWQYTNFEEDGSTEFTTHFALDKHDTTNKTFSSHYGNTIITGRSTATAGDDELADLVDMLLNHPQCARFICRKLYRWYVNPNVDQTIEDNVIIPLANFFASPTNNFAIQPVIVKLLTSQIFFDNATIGSMVKAPVDLAVGMMRFFNQPVPTLPTDYAAFKIYGDFLYYRMQDMLQPLMDQPSVFGYEPYYQTGFSRVWINTTTIGYRYQYTDAYAEPFLMVSPTYQMGIDVVAWATQLQRAASPTGDFSDVPVTPAVTCTVIVNTFIKNLFAVELFTTQVDFLIDTIMMGGLPRTSWNFEWNAYRSEPTNGGYRYAVLDRMQKLVKFILRMAEFHIC